MSDIHQHGDWLIWHAPAPIESRHLDWHFAHKDFTSEHVDCDPRCGNAESLEQARELCDFHDDMEAEDATPEAQARDEAQAKRLTDKAMVLIATVDIARALHQLLQIPGIGNLPGFATGINIQQARGALERFLQYYPEFRVPEGEGA